MAEFRSLRAVGVRLWQNILNFSTGGSWLVQLPPQAQRNLRWYTSDGIFSTASDAIPATFLTLYILALGATRTQIGLLSALSSLMATLVLLPGAFMTERWGKRKLIVLLGGGGFYRLSFPLLLLLPFFVKGPAAVLIAIGIKVMADGFANLSFPAWMSMTADIIPLAWRGRYYGNRNIMTGLASMLVTLGIGQLITSLGSPIGYQVSLGIALLFGAAATFSYAHIDLPEKAPAPQGQTYSLGGILQSLRENPNFTYYMVHAMVWNFAIMIAGPFFGPYQVQGLHSTAAIVGIVSIAGSIASLPVQRYFGRLSDRWGEYRMMMFSGLLVPFVPIMWIFTSAPWHAIPVNAISGLIWGAFNLAAFNFLLSLAPSDQLPRFSAFIQIAVAIASALGALLGGVIATRWGYNGVFLVSGIGRFIGILLFIRLVRPLKKTINAVEPQESPAP